MLIKPPGIEHADRFGPHEVTCINLELEPQAWDEFAGGSFLAPTVLTDPRLQTLGQELACEPAARDRASTLAAEGLVLTPPRDRLEDA